MAQPAAPLHITMKSMATFFVAGGLAVSCFALFLYATALSRAIALWISPLGAASLITGLWSWRSGRRPGRVLVMLMAIVALALVVLGLSTLVVALQAEDQAA